MVSTEVKAKVRGLSIFYSDGTEIVEIWINKKYKSLLPAKNNQRIPIFLTVSNHSFMAGLRMTPKCPVLWICPNLEDKGEKVRLADVMENNNFRKNDALLISVLGKEFKISRKNAQIPTKKKKSL